jgi:hypothetical protein
VLDHASSPRRVASLSTRSTEENPITYLPIYLTMTSGLSPIEFLTPYQLHADPVERLFLFGRLNAALPCGSAITSGRSTAYRRPCASI